jgi:hypothetical protein
MADNETSLSGFAAILEVKPSYVTKLKQQGRLVFDAAGKKVLIAESRELIEQTAGNRTDVAKRNQEKREEGAPSKSTHPAGKGGVDKRGKKADDDAPPDSQKEAIKQAQVAKALAESRRVQALADKEEMERDRLAGKLIPREEVEAALKFIGGAVRAQADVYADQTTPLVAPITDLNEVHEILAQSRKDELAALGLVIQQQRVELQKEAV